MKKDIKLLLAIGFIVGSVLGFAGAFGYEHSERMKWGTGLVGACNDHWKQQLTGLINSVEQHCQCE